MFTFACRKEVLDEKSNYNRPCLCRLVAYRGWTHELARSGGYTPDKRIRESEGYPQLESIRLSGWIEGWIKEDSPLGRELARLVGEGLLIPVPGTFWRYEPNGKGKDLVDKCVWKNYYNKEWENFDPLAYKWDVTESVNDFGTPRVRI